MNSVWGSLRRVSIVLLDVGVDSESGGFQPGFGGNREKRFIPCAARILTVWRVEAGRGLGLIGLLVQFQSLPPHFWQAGRAFGGAFSPIEASGAPASFRWPPPPVSSPKYRTRRNRGGTK